jgi:hypothetical protein
VNNLKHPMTGRRAPHPGSRASSAKGGTLIAERVHDAATHERLLTDPDGYRPDLCLHCDGDVLHAHDYVERRPRGAPDDAAEIRIRRYICANKECQATWRILPAFLSRHLWRVWPTVEQVVLPAPPPAVSAPPPAPIPKRTAQRWRERLASQAKQLVVLLAVSGGAVLEAIAKHAGLLATRAELVDVHARMTETPLAPGRRLADLAAIVHRLERGLRLM